MAIWYSTGTVTVTNGSSTVTGSGTAFDSGGRVGDGFVGPDGKLYEVTNIASSTVLSINPNYLGTTSSAQDYKLIPVQGYVKSSADALNAFTALNLEGGLAVASGGTGATTASDARDNLSAVSRVVSVDDNIPTFNGTGGEIQDSGESISSVLADAQSAWEAYGLGVDAISSVEADLDTITESGTYSFASTTSNIPSVIPAVYTGICIHQARSTATSFVRAVQIVLGQSQDGTVDYFYTRVNRGGTWGSWKPIIPEYGSNANGWYVKFPDGTLICVGADATITTDTPINNIMGSTSGTSYQAALQVTLPYTPASSSYFANPNSFSVSSSFGLRIYSQTTTTLFIRGWSASNGGTYDVNYLLVGRWY